MEPAMALRTWKLHRYFDVYNRLLFILMMSLLCSLLSLYATGTCCHTVFVADEAPLLEQIGHVSLAGNDRKGTST